ncbi:MAG: YbhB/YbcL family Raf kinase inhibitor-like protein [Acidobacteria bacterium]|nr:MAG: YbhB/YbcL family Raf kinase inhibitor-like protein [Acidobacteriota bacterium]
MRYVFTALIALSLCLSPFLGATPAGQTQGGSMKIVSSAFSANEMIPKKFTCDGPDASPKLSWNEPPAKTQSFALIMDDPDAPVGTWVHWVLFDLPADTRELAEGVAKQEQLANRARQGRNDFGQIGYGGPCPPPGNPHRYFFKVYALDAKLALKAGVTKADVERAMKGHILGQAELIGRYGR